MQQRIKDVKLFWQTVPFFGSRLEDGLARYWYVVFSVPFAIFLAWGFWLDKYRSQVHSLHSVTYVLRDPFVVSLGVAFLFSGIAFNFWQSTVRRTFSTAVETGLVANNPVADQGFLEASTRFQLQMRSPGRFVSIAIAFAAALIAQREKFGWIIGLTHTAPRALLFFEKATSASFLCLSYALGAVPGLLLVWPDGSPPSQVIHCFGYNRDIRTDVAVWPG
jgi:hypothetical protein